MKLIANREVAWTALFAVLEAMPEFAFCTRKLKHWNEVEASNQPAAFLTHTGEVTIPTHGLPAKVVLEGEIWIYARTDGLEAGPVVNALLDAVEKAFTPPPGVEKFTLGGLAHHCWIEGQTQIFEGNLGDEAVATIPVKLLVT